MLSSSLLVEHCMLISRKCNNSKGNFCPYAILIPASQTIDLREIWRREQKLQVENTPSAFLMLRVFLQLNVTSADKIDFRVVIVPSGHPSAPGKVNTFHIWRLMISWKMLAELSQSFSDFYFAFKLFKMF